jgi:hypothetical protein
MPWAARAPTTASPSAIAAVMVQWPISHHVASPPTSSDVNANRTSTSGSPIAVGRAQWRRRTRETVTGGADEPEIEAIS